MPMVRLTLAVRRPRSPSSLAPAAHAAGLAATQQVLRSRDGARGRPTAAPTSWTSAPASELYASKADVARMPASVEKLYTTATALLLYGAGGHADHVGAVRRRCRTRPATIAGDVVLRGGGDPTFNAATAAALAKQLADAGLKRIDGPRDRRRVRVRRVPRRRRPPDFRPHERGRPAERARLQPRPHRQGRARTSRRAPPASPPQAFEKALKRARREDHRQGPRGPHARRA